MLVSQGPTASVVVSGCGSNELTQHSEAGVHVSFEVIHGWSVDGGSKWFSSGWCDDAWCLVSEIRIGMSVVAGVGNLLGMTG